MADRSVTVTLIARIQDFERGMAQAIAVTKKFESELKDLQRPTMELAHVGETADDVSHDLTQLAATSEVAGRRIDDIGDEAVGAAAKLGILGHELDSVDRKASSLGGKAGKGALGSLGELGTSLRGAMVPAIGAALIGAAPIIGVAIGTAVTGAAGLGGIVGGLVLAARNPSVQAAYAQLGTHLLTDLEKSATPFQAVSRNWASAFSDEWDRTVGPSIARSFHNLAGPAGGLGAGITGFARELAPGLEALSRAAGPIISELGRTLPGLGASITRFAQSMEAAAPGLAMFTGDLIKATGAALEFIGKYVELSAKLYEVGSYNAVGRATRMLIDGNHELIGAYAEIPPQLDATTRALVDNAAAAATTAAENQALTASFEVAAAAANGLVVAWDALHGEELSADEALLAAKHSVDALAESFRANHGAITGNSEAALENRIAMGNAGRAAADAAQKYFDATGDIDGARRIMDQQRAAAERAAIANGGNAREVHNLAAEMFKMPKNVTSHVTVTGALAARAAVDALAGAIAGVHSKTVYLTTVVSTTGKIASARAEGGEVEAGVPYTINERGYETVTFPAGGMVHPANLSPARTWNGGGGSSGDGGTTTVLIDVRADSEEQAARIRKQVRILGGGNVQLAYGSASF